MEEFWVVLPSFLKKICTLQKFLGDELRREAKFVIRSDSFIIIFFPFEQQKKNTPYKGHLHHFSWLITSN